MLKNKIYKYFFIEILKNFSTILLTFATIAWVVKAVNFLDLMVEDGYGSSIYFKYSLLNITTIISRFVPLAFLLSLTISIVKFERQQELQILWTTGLSKIKIINVFLLIGISITLFQLFLSLIANPFLLNKSRTLLSSKGTFELNMILRSNNFSDTFKGLTFYIEKKNENNELINIFIKDSGGNLNTLINEVGKKKNTTVTARKGFETNNKLILFDGVVQTLNQDNEIQNILFEKTELSLKNLSTRTIKKPKIQETSTVILLDCVLKPTYNLNSENCSASFQKEAIQNLSRRLGSPLYIPLISIITSFLLFYKKEKTYNFLKKYMLFIISFFLLIFSEIFLKYTSYSKLLAISYFMIPITISVLFYICLIKKGLSKKI